MKEIQRLLALFADAHGVSGHEGAIASLLAAELEPLVDEVSTDGMGNAIGTRAGTGPSIMIAAHIDEIGFMVKYIDDRGFLRFVPLGGWFDQMALGQRVFVHGSNGPLVGVIGAKPPHIMDDEERKKIVKIKDMFIDIGASDPENAAALGVEIGSPVTLDRTMALLANDLVTGKSFDDRAGVVMMLLAMKRLKGKKVKATVHAVGTVQEEVGLKGARTSAFNLDPDAAIISEVGIPGDHPGVTKEQRHIEMGKGPILTVVDADGRGVIVPKKILTWLPEVIPSPSDTTNAGRAFLAADPDSTGSLGMAISEAVEVAAMNDDTHYSLGSVLNHVMHHQTVIGQEAMQQIGNAGDYPDIIIGCAGGGSNFAGISFPFLGANIREDKKTRIIAVEPAACPSLTKGIYAYDFGDVAKLTPLLKMYTLGHDFVPAGIHAGGLRYHAMAPMVSHALNLGLIEAEAYTQNSCFQAAVQFARTEGIIPAPESSHALASVVNAAEQCKQSGEAKTILVNLSGHGHFDMASYDNYLAGNLQDYAYPEEKVHEAQAHLPQVG